MLRLFVFLVLLLLVLSLISAAQRDAKARVGHRSAPARPERMTRAEALQVLGLNEGASKAEILAQYKHLMSKVHPDTPGGSTYLAAQINQARDVLLG